MKNFVHLIALIAPLVLSGCSSLGLSALNLSSRIDSGHQVIENIPYGEEHWQTLDIHRPSSLDRDAQQDAASSRPVVVFLYGGGWTSGNKEQYYFAASAFTKLGYVVVVPDYVKYPTARFPAFVNDSARAVAWSKAHIASHGGDPSRLFIVGHSAGAHIGALLVADPQYLAASGVSTSDITAFAGMAGPYNFTPARKPYTDIFGPEENYPKMQVMNFIQGDEPPMMLLHGTGDKTVGILNKDSLLEKIVASGGEPGNITYPGVSHVGILLSFHPSYIGQADAALDIDAFFQQQLNQLGSNTTGSKTTTTANNPTNCASIETKTLNAASYLAEC